MWLLKGKETKYVISLHILEVEVTVYLISFDLKSRFTSGRQTHWLSVYPQ